PSFAGVYKRSCSARPPRLRRADLLRRMRRRVPADDDELLLVDGLDLQPLLRAPRLVHRRLPLGDDALEAVLRGVEQGLVAAHVELLGNAHEGGGAAEG